MKHHKTVWLAAELGVNRREALGIRGALIGWAIDNRPGGIIERELIPFACDWDAESDRLILALIKTRLVDENSDGTFSIHDWDQYTRGYKKAKRDSLRLKRLRKKASRDCRATKADASRSVAVNRTEQNRTEQSRTDPAVQRQKPGSSQEAVLVSHWNKQDKRMVIGLDKGVRLISVAVAAGVPLQEIERAFWDDAGCAGKTMFEVLDPLKKAKGGGPGDKGWSVDGLPDWTGEKKGGI